MNKRILSAIAVMSLFGFAPAAGQAASLAGAAGQAVSQSGNGVTLAAAPTESEVGVWELAWHSCRHYRNAHQRHACEVHYNHVHPYGHPYAHPYHHHLPGH